MTNTTLLSAERKDNNRLKLIQELTTRIVNSRETVKRKFTKCVSMKWVSDVAASDLKWTYNNIKS